MLKYTSNHNKKNINNENIPIHDENQYLSLIRDNNLYGSM